MKKVRRKKKQKEETRGEVKKEGSLEGMQKLYKKSTIESVAKLQ